MIALPRPACSRGSWDRGCPGIPEWVGWVRWVSHNSLRGFPDIPRRYSCARWVSQNLCPRMRWVSQNFPNAVGVPEFPESRSPELRGIVRMSGCPRIPLGCPRVPDLSSECGGCPRISRVGVPEFQNFSRWVATLGGCPTIPCVGFPTFFAGISAPVGCPRICAPECGGCPTTFKNLCPRMRWVSHNFQDSFAQAAAGNSRRAGCGR